MHHVCSLCLSLLWIFVASLEDCPKKNERLKSGGSGTKAKITFDNKMETDVLMVWIDFKGVEHEQNVVASHQSEEQGTFIGHAFRAYTSESRALVFEYTVKSEKETVAINSCQINGKDVATDVAKERAAEFEALMHDHSSPCLPADDSARWSCVRAVPLEEYNHRTRDRYGFATQEEAGSRHIGDEFDTGYTRHISKMPRLTNGPGFLKLNFTKKLRDELLPWYHSRKADSMQKHEPIGGGYTNINVHRFDKINLDKFPKMHNTIIREMHKILEWWVQDHLKHTATFGVRVYRREAMLINHVDREDTHIASAVLQVAQQSDADGGWPLEVISETGEPYEVYLQPGEMVLYEGGKLRHGRPMRFRGEEFANVFSHFCPLAWHGPGRSPEYIPHIQSQDPSKSLRGLSNLVTRAAEPSDEVLQSHENEM